MQLSTNNPPDNQTQTNTKHSHEDDTNDHGFLGRLGLISYFSTTCCIACWICSSCCVVEGWGGDDDDGDGGDDGDDDDKIHSSI